MLMFKQSGNNAAYLAPALSSWVVIACCYCLCATNAFETLPAIFPTSIRNALVEKSKALNDPILSQTQSSYYNYGKAGWSNRAATVLTPQAEGVWTADRPFYWNSIDVSCRCTILELPSSKQDGSTDLFVHAPVALDGPMKQACDKLGTVRYVAATNYEHVSYAKQWFDGYPNAELWACPGLMSRMPEIKWTGEISQGYRPVSWRGFRGNSVRTSWDDTIVQPLHIDVERNPFTGKSFFNEVVYYHAPSKTVLMTDLFWNFPRDAIPNSQFGRDDSWELAPSSFDSVPLKSRLWKAAMDQVYSRFYQNFMISDRSKFRAIAQHIVNEWDVEMVIPAHGDILRGKQFIRNVLTRHFQL